MVFMVCASRIIKVNLEEGVLMKNSMSDNVFNTALLHLVSLKGIKINSEVTSMNFLLLLEIYL